MIYASYLWIFLVLVIFIIIILSILYGLHTKYRTATIGIAGVLLSVFGVILLVCAIAEISWNLENSIIRIIIATFFIISGMIISWSRKSFIVRKVRYDYVALNKEKKIFLSLIGAIIIIGILLSAFLFTTRMFWIEGGVIFEESSFKVSIIALGSYNQTHVNGHVENETMIDRRNVTFNITADGTQYVLTLYTKGIRVDNAAISHEFNMSVFYTYNGTTRPFRIVGEQNILNFTVSGGRYWDVIVNYPYTGYSIHSANTWDVIIDLQGVDGYGCIEVILLPLIVN